MSGRGDEIRMRKWAGMDTGGDEAGDVCHIDEEITAYLFGELTHALEIDDAGVGGCADGDEGGLELAGGFFQLIVVDALVVRRDAVVSDIVEAAGKIRFMAVSEVAAVGEVHGENFITRLED